VHVVAYSSKGVNNLFSTFFNVNCIALAGYAIKGDMDYHSSGRNYSTPPHRRGVSKVDRLYGGRLFMDIHKGFITFYRRRGIPAPTVSTTTIELPYEFQEWAQKRGGV
jgi:hypothetical protein